MWVIRFVPFLFGNGFMYKAPIDDMNFALETLSQEMPHLAQSLPDAEMIDVILNEAGKLAGDVIAPLNHEADKKGGAVRQDDGSVKTPDGFADSLQRVAGRLWKRKRRLAVRKCRLL